MVVNSGFNVVRKTDTAKIGTATTNKEAGEELFLKSKSDIVDIKGTGAATNVVTVNHVVGVTFVIGDIISIVGVSTPATDYNKDTGVKITAVDTTTKFRYETTNHTESVLSLGSGKILVPDPYILTETDINTVLQTFIHLSVCSSVKTKLEVTRDNVKYFRLANDEALIGDIFRSLTLKLGDSFNARFVDATFVGNGVLVQE